MPKFIYQPLKPFVVTQLFGESKACVDLKTGKKVISCNGLRPPKGYKSLYLNGHKGVDMRAKHGQPVYSASDGVVEFIDTQPKSGLDVRVVFEHEGKKYRCIYEHLLGYQKKIGDRVFIGDLIGWADNTGYSSGDHLHFQFEVWNKSWKAIDPMPFMYPTYALDIAPLYNRLKELMAQLADVVAEGLRT
jgi:murein DD-endopeptidase MepM/ murein hydrolase activator NlpD